MYFKQHEVRKKLNNQSLKSYYLNIENSERAFNEQYIKKFLIEKILNATWTFKLLIMIRKYEQVPREKK